MNRSEIKQWLLDDDEARLDELWQMADQTRRVNVGDEVHLRGLIEISNHCVRRCAYCGINAEHHEVTRYRMEREEIISCARDAAEFGYGTVVMQAGEDYGIGAEWLAGIVRQIKAETPLAITLSMGERLDEELALWREAGADRYLLRFETSDSDLYRLIHPDNGVKISDRMEILRTLQNLGYEAGSGVMIGIPGQSFDTLANDIALFSEMDLDMVGVGPYIPHPDTPLGSGEVSCSLPVGEQVPNTELMAYKVVALVRVNCPEINIPSTTAIATLNKDSGRELGLMRGANVVMPNLTPRKYRKFYEIYPAKACLDETASECRSCMKGRITSIGRTVGSGQGGRKRKK